MSRQLLARTSVLLGMLMACGDNDAAPCDPESQTTDNWRIGGCPAALVFASRDTADLLPSQQEVERYLDRWQRAIAAEPILSKRIPQRYRLHGSLSINTTDPRLIEAWSQRRLRTGDVELDQMLAQIDATLGPVRDRGSYVSASLNTTYIFNEEFLAEALLTRSSWMPEPEVWPRDDGMWVWIDADE